MANFSATRLLKVGLVALIVSFVFVLRALPWLILGDKPGPGFFLLASAAVVACLATVVFLQVFRKIDLLEKAQLTSNRDRR